MIARLVLELEPWKDDPLTIGMSAGAHDLLVEMEAEAESRLVPGGELGNIADWGSKWLGAVVRLAGLLHLADHPGQGPRLIDRTTVERAGKLGMYFRDHARLAFEEMRVDPNLENARYLLEVIRRQGERMVSRRDLHVAASRSRFPKASDLDSPLQVLEENGYIRRREDTPGGPGRPRSPMWFVNPRLLQS